MLRLTVVTLLRRHALSAYRTQPLGLTSHHLLQLRGICGAATLTAAPFTAGHTTAAPSQLFNQLHLARLLSSSSGKDQQGKQNGDPNDKPVDSLEVTEEQFSALTDKIPQRPVGVVEGTSYTLLIVGAFAVLGFFIYNFVTDFILEPVALQCFNHALERLKKDPRITVRLGEDIRAYGRESQGRLARQQIPHAVYKDNEGHEHVRLQFHMRGPGGTALVSADMYKDNDKNWQYTYLVADVATAGSQSAQRLNIVAPSSVR